VAATRQYAKLYSLCNRRLQHFIRDFHGRLQMVLPIRAYDCVRVRLGQQVMCRLDFSRHRSPSVKKKYFLEPDPEMHQGKLFGRPALDARSTHSNERVYRLMLISVTSRRVPYCSIHTRRKPAFNYVSE
jgi:hypothetical protein